MTYTLETPADKAQNLPSYAVKVIRTVEEFAGIQSEWENLFANAHCQNRALTYLWLNTALLNTRQTAPFIILVANSAGEWIGAAPLKITQIQRGLFARLSRRLEFIGTNPSTADKCEFLFVAESDTHKNEILEVMISAVIENRSDWDCLALAICSDEHALQTIQSRLERYTVSPEIHPDHPIPYLLLDGSLETYQKELKNQLRKNLNNWKNRIGKHYPSQNLNLKTWSVSPECMSHLERFFEKHIAYWEVRGVKSEFKVYPELQTFFKTLIQAFPEPDLSQNPFIFSTLNVGDTVISYHMGVWNDGVYQAQVCWYDEQYRQYRPGFLHFDLLIRFSIENQAKRFEFGRGDMDYKTLWMIEKESLFAFTAYRTKFSALCHQIDRQLLALKRKITGFNKKEQVDPSNDE